MIKRSLATFLVILLLPFGFQMGGFSSALAGAEAEPYTLYLPAVMMQRQPEWIGPDGGVITALAVDSLNADVLYAGSWGAGVFKSYNRGESWTPASQGIGNLYINALAADPANPPVLYAGTYHGKLYKSLDAGQSWFLSSQGIQDEAIVYSIVIDPQNTNNVYIATRGISNNENRPWNGVVYKSTDAGATWLPSLYDLGGKNYQDWVYALAIHPKAPNILFAATHEHGPLRSKNYGRTWEQVADGITNFSTRAIAVDPYSSKAGTVYTGVWTKDGVFKSTDGGDSWELKSSGLIGANIYGMAIDLSQPRSIYLAAYNRGILRTSNGGNTWFSSGLQDSPTGAVAISPVDPQLLVAGSSGNGLFISNDHGDSWQHRQSGLRASMATSLVVDPEGASLYASVFGGGVAKSTDRGLTWVDFNQNLGDRNIYALVKHPLYRILYALTQDSGLYRCDLTTGDCWTKTGGDLLTAVQLAAQPSEQPAAQPTAQKASGSASFFRDDDPFSTLESLLGRNLDPAFIPSGTAAGTAAESAAGTAAESAAGTAAASAAGTAAALAGDFSGIPLVMQFSLSRPDTAYLGTDGGGVFRTDDAGQNWTWAGLRGQKVWSLAVDPQDPQRVFAASSQPGSVQSSQDGGANWSNLSLPGRGIYSLALSAALYAGTDDGVYILSNGAWVPSGLSGAAVTVLAAHPAKPNELFAGTSQGAYYSLDGGASWLPGPAELKGILIQSIQFDPRDPSLVYFCTKTNGVLRWDTAIQ